ncbi:hypothetical protein [Streptomyces avidinii]|uniref:hypothetical protein n=1 Tax=Streptomyces avidinii TaxID=1895 RepID=UPI00167A1436|nr:hypothetical protein [Streptomyces avidinii]GGY81967.1 hypothetical protein GCM10010343_03320 [Streptomyces avidinii]
MDSAVEAVHRYRRPDPACWDIVVDAVCGESSSLGADRALVQGGPAIARHADRIAADLRRQQGVFGTAVSHGVSVRAIALAGTGDVRALPALRHLAEHGGLPYNRPEARVMAALPAAELVPVMRTKLRRDADDYHGNTTTLEVLGLCGEAAALAVAEVARRLDMPYAYDAMRVLGRIGPAAVATADRLAAYATGRDPRTSRNHPRRAAWAHWRVTGDPTLALDVCGAAVRSGSAGHGLPLLADLGPLATAHADAVHGLLDSPGAWTRVAAADAYWRITGDPEPAVPVLLAEVDPDWTGRPAVPVQEAVGRLGEIGTPAAGAVPLLRRILAREERLTHAFDRTRILADEAYVRTLTDALERIAPGAGDTVPASRHVARKG